MGETGLVPVVVIDDAADAKDTAKALAIGGIDVMEVTLRTDAGLNAIASVAEHCPDMLVGAGTVLSIDSCKEAVQRGAQFIVSPGFDAKLVAWCLEQDVPIYPGCVTPTEIMMAIEFGLDTLKFFPANIYGGVRALKALAGPFPGIRFIPTGGVDTKNLYEYVSKEVAAIGGGWLCPRKDIKAKNWASITEVCKQSTEIIQALK